MGFADKQGIYSKFRHSNFTQCGQEYITMFFQKLPKNCTFNNLDSSCSNTIKYRFISKRNDIIKHGNKKNEYTACMMLFFALPTLRPLPQNQRTMQGRIKHKDLDVFRDLASMCINPSSQLRCSRF